MNICSSVRRSLLRWRHIVFARCVVQRVIDPPQPQRHTVTLSRGRGCHRCRCGHCYRQDLPEGQFCRYFVYSRADFGVFRLAGATRCTDQGQIWQISPWSVQGWVFTAPKTEKKFEFYEYIIAHKGRVPCTIFTKFTVYVRVLSLYNASEFGCFISINDKIINNLLRWGVFSKFSTPPSGKTMDGTQKSIGHKMMARTITMQNLVEIARRTSERGCTVNWATNQLGDRRLGDIPTGRQPTGRQRLVNWATKP